MGGVDTQCQFLKEVGTTLLGVHPLSHFLGGGWPHFFTFSSSAIVHFLQEHLRANSPGLFNPSSNFCQKMCSFSKCQLPQIFTTLSQNFIHLCNFSKCLPMRNGTNFFFRFSSTMQLVQLVNLNPHSIFRHT